MSVQRTIYCDGPDCGGEGGLRGGHTSCHVSTASPPPYLPISFIEVRERHDMGDEIQHFCGWDCLMKYAAKQPIPERIEWDDIAGGSD